MSEVDEGVIRRIKKCLAMANDGRGNAAEAATALRMAQKLMEAHGVDPKTLVRADFGQASVDTSAWSKLPVWEMELAWLVARAFGCKFMQTTFGGKGIQNAKMRKTIQLTFIGLKYQVELASYAYSVVRRSTIQARTRYIAEIYGTRGEKMAAGESFSRAYIGNVRKQVNDLVIAPEHEAVIDEIIHEETGGRKAKPAPKGRPVDYAALRAGAEAGKDLSLHRPVSTSNETKIGD